MNSTEDRIKFTRAIASEGSAYLFALILSWSLTNLVFGYYYFFVSKDYVTGKKLIVNQAFEDWLFITLFFLSFLVIYLWRIGYYKDKIREWKVEKKEFSLLKIIGIGVGSGILFFALVKLYELIFKYFFGEDYFLADVWLGYKDIALWQRILIFLSLVLVYPICNELFFRQLMFGNIFRRGFTKTAYIFSSALFCITYFTSEYLLFNILYCLLITYLYQKTRSILIPLIATSIFSIFSFYPLIV